MRLVDFVIFVVLWRGDRRLRKDAEEPRKDRGIELDKGVKRRSESGLITPHELDLKDV